MIVALTLAWSLATAAPAPPDTAALDSLTARLRSLMDRGATSGATNLARTEFPRVVAAGAGGGPHFAAAVETALEALSHSEESMPVEAESLGTLAVAIRRRGPDSLALARALHLASIASSFDSHGPTAVRRAREALAILRARTPRDTAMIAVLLAMIGNASLMSEDAASAERNFREALALQEARRGAADPANGELWMGLASAAWSRGDVRGAQRLYERALGLILNQRPLDAQEVLITLQGLMQTNAPLGDLPSARRYGVWAITFADSAFGPNHRLTAFAHSRFADVLGSLDDAAEAHRQAEIGVAIGRRAYHRPNSVLASILKISGECDYDLHDLDGAAERIAEAIHVHDAAIGGGDGWSNHARSRLAVVESERGRPQRALGLIASVWDRQVQLGGRWQTGTEEDLARVHRKLGHYVAAESLFAALAGALDDQLGPRAALALLAHQEHAASRYDRGDRAGALAEARAAQRVSREVVADAVPRLADREASSFERALTRGEALALTLASDARGLPAAGRLDAWDMVARTRLAVLRERAEARRAIRGDDPEVLRRARELDAARDTLARVAVRALTAGHSDSLEARLTAARLRRDDAMRALGDVSATYRAAHPPVQVGIAEALAALPSDAALVAYRRFEFRQTPVPADSGLKPESEPRYVALVRAPGRTDIDIVNLGAAKSLEALVERWGERSARPIAPADTLARRRYRELGARLRERVWDPVRARLGAAERVFVVPDGAIHSINLAALPVARDAWLVEAGPVIELIGNETDLVRDGTGAPEGRGLLALAEPDFGGVPHPGPAGSAESTVLAAGLRSTLRDADSLVLAPLPGSGEEGRALANLWGADAGRGAARLLLGAEATEAAFKAEAPGHRVLHLATHAISLAGRRVELTAGARGVGGVTGGAPAEERSDLAALALAGAGRRDSARTGEDGWLTSEEVLSLDLSGVDWAVLSACETGVGSPRARESVQGLVRAFRIAGARTVIASLWQVDDRATRDWMTRVYRARWQEGRNTADAVREACRETLADRRAHHQPTDPFYWAGFIATGSDR